MNLCLKLKVSTISTLLVIKYSFIFSLEPGCVYSVQVAGVYGRGAAAPAALGPFSAARSLSFKTHEVVLVNTEEIPLKVWAIAMAIVIIVTLTIVMAAALLCYKTKKMRGGSSRGGGGGSQHTCSEYGVSRGGGGVTTWDRRWMDCDGDEHSPTTSFRSENRLLQAAGGGYDYAVPSQHHLLHHLHYGGGGGGGQAAQYSSGGGGGGSNHYASNTILKPAYYEPLNVKMVDTSNSSFESDYKMPMDMSRR